jgi:O-antigen/teichoic acid export membrane protein
MIGGLATTAMLTRALDPADVGTYLLIMTVAAVASTFGLAGMGKAVVRLVPAAMTTGRPDDAAGAIASAFRASAAATAAVAALLALGVGRLVGDLVGFDPTATIIGLLVLWFVLQTLQALLAETFRSFHDIRAAALFNGGFRSVVVVTILATVLLLGTELTVPGAVTISIVGLAVSNVVAALLLRRHLRGLDNPSPVPHRSVLEIGWPLMVNQLLVFVIMRANLWIISGELDAEQVAVYGAVIQLITLLTTPLLLMNAVLPPMISEMYADSGQHRRLERTLRSVATIAGLPSLAVLGLFAVAGPFVLGQIFGSFYRQGAAALAILGLSQLANVWTGMCGPLLAMTGHQRALMWFNLVFGFVAVTGALFLVPRWGIEGAAVSTTAAIIGQNAAVATFAKRKTGIISVGEIRPWVLVAEAKALTGGRLR